MRVPSFLFLAAGIVLAAALAVMAPDVSAFLTVQTETVRRLLVAGASAFAAVWFLVLWLSMRIDERDVEARVAGRQGREEITRQRQKSVDLEDRQNALEEYISTADARRTLRRSIVIEVALPYLILASVSAVVLFMVLKNMGIT